MERKFIKYVSSFSWKNKFYRLSWQIISLLFFRPIGLTVFNSWRILLLKLFGAKIGKGSIVYASANISQPNNLSIGVLSCIGPKVKLHVGKIVIGSKVTISQGSYLCSGSHDINYLNKPFVSEPIVIHDFAWVAAEAFIMMGVTIGEGAVVGARAAVFKDVEPWTVVGGNPAKFIKKREIKD